MPVEMYFASARTRPDTLDIIEEACDQSWLNTLSGNDNSTTETRTPRNF